jgi:serralysin
LIPTTPTTPTTPSPSATPYVAVLDTTTSQNISVAGSAYSGPVSGLQYQYVYTDGDSVNITVTSDNWFLHGGPGGDAIHASGGYNVLDGGAGSNFLTGGGGTDTFYVDDRNPSGDLWSTVNGFHSGDDATVFGIVPNGSNIQWFDNQGAAGYTGLTLHVPAANAPTASLTLAGYSSSDLGNGRLNVSFGNEADGTPYMHVIAS